MRRVAPVLVGLALLAGCGSDSTDDVVAHSTTSTTEVSGTSTTTAAAPGNFAYGTAPCPPATPPADTPHTFADAPQRCTKDGVDYGAEIATSEGTMTVDLLEGSAPGTVNNFVVLARWGWYDGDDFHRVVKDFMSQAGDPFGDPQGTGGPGYTIPDELPPAADAYAKGTLAMANTGSPNTGGSQWFVCWACSLPPQYSVFGEVTGGKDVIDKMNALGVQEGPPTTPITITSVKITEK